MSVAPVRREIVVEASQQRAFNVFTQEQGAWWPLATHHVGDKPAETAIIEPRAGGRWFERAQDGSECDWGRVLVWDPPGRLVLAWTVTPKSLGPEPVMTEVEIRFVAVGPATTRIELEHRFFERFGDAAERMSGAYGSDNGWTTVLRLYAARARG
jgi:hypothetical protein